MKKLQPIFSIIATTLFFSNFIEKYSIRIFHGTMIALAISLII